MFHQLAEAMQFNQRHVDVLVAGTLKTAYLYLLTEL